MKTTLEEILEKHEPKVFDNQRRTWAYTEEQVSSIVSEAVNAKLQEVAEKIKKLHSESKKLERHGGTTGFIEFGKTNAYRNSLLILNESLTLDFK